MRYVKPIVACLITLLLTTRAFADEGSPPATLLWKKVDNRPVLVVQLSGQLTPRQVNLINSGFSTFSVLTAKLKGAEKNAEALVKISCTVKYDTWQERYDLARLDKNVGQDIVKDFQKYADQCLTLELNDPELLKTLAPDGGQLLVSLMLDQISVTKANEVKEWLIKQQSGVMQGLFSHMLGDLTMTESTDILVRVPANLTISTMQDRL